LVCVLARLSILFASFFLIYGLLTHILASFVRVPCSCFCFCVAGEYDTSRYQDFQATCPFLKNKKKNVDALFEQSSIDGETIVPKNHSEFFPVFAAGNRAAEFPMVNGPKYCPFGLGYRRCPAEIFNMMILQKLLAKLGNLDFKSDAQVNLFEVMVTGVEGFDEAVPVGLTRVNDALYVDDMYAALEFGTMIALLRGNKEVHIS
jgi:hypothetical protein